MRRTLVLLALLTALAAGADDAASSDSRAGSEGSPRSFVVQLSPPAEGRESRWVEGTPEDFKALVLKGETSENRVQALSFLHRRSPESISDILPKLAESDADTGVRQAAVEALASRPGGADATLRSALLDPAPEVRAAAATALGARRPPGLEDVTALLEALSREWEPQARRRMVAAAAAWVDGHSQEAWAGDLMEAIWEVARDPAAEREEAIEAVGALRPVAGDMRGFAKRLSALLAELRSASAPVELTRAVRSKLAPYRRDGSGGSRGLEASR